MSEDKFNRNNGGSDFDELAMSELEGLSNKYGVSADDKPEYTLRSAPRNNRPAFTPKVVYEKSETGVPHAKMSYQNGDTTDSGRQTVYSENIAVNVTPTRTPQRRENFSGMSKPVDEPGVSRTFQKLYNEVKEDETAAKAPAVQPAPKRSFLSAIFPAKGDGAKEVFRKIVMDISAIVVIVCIAYFVHDYIEHRNQLKVSEDVALVTTVARDELAEKWAEIKAKYPDVNFPEGMNIKFAEAYARNQHLIGWIRIDGTNIDSPVMHNPDDRYNGSTEDFYLHHDIYGAENKYGNTYLDMWNTGTTLDKNNIIYGHNMTDGLMFAQLEKYYKIEGFKASPIIEYSTLFNDYKFKVYAVFITNGDSGGDNGYLFDYTTTNFISDENFRLFIEGIDERKLYTTGVDINTQDTLITLSTCSYEISTDNMGRLAVVGRLLREGEDEKVDTSLAQYRDNVRYPQVWYDERGIYNPFEDAFRWTVNS